MGFKAIFVFAIVVPAFSYADQRHCPGNELKGRYMCNCHEGNFIRSVSSTFNRHSDDRVWNISCSTESQYVSKGPRCEDLTTRWTSFKNDFSLTFKSHQYSCLFKHGMLTGWESEYDTKSKDRRYRFTYSIPNMFGVVISSCRDRKVSSFETQGHFAVSEGHIIHGIKSVYNSKYNDREWTINVCMITRECDVIKDITFSKFDDPKDVLSYAEIKRESQVTDATGHDGDIEAELTLSSETSKQLTETQRFESSSASSVSNTASISVSTSVEVPFVVMQIEGGYEYRSEKMSSKTWSRETTTEYSETNGKEMEWQYICKAGTRCEAVVSIYQATVKVPYSMKVMSSNSMQVCNEKGLYERVQTFTKFHVKSAVPTTTVKTTTTTTEKTTSTTTFSTTLKTIPTTIKPTTPTKPKASSDNVESGKVGDIMKTTPTPVTHQAPLPLKSEKQTQEASKNVETAVPNSTTGPQEILDTATGMLFINDTVPIEQENGNHNITEVPNIDYDNYTIVSDIEASGLNSKGGAENITDDERHLVENQAVSPLEDEEDTNTLRYPGGNRKDRKKDRKDKKRRPKLGSGEENLTTKIDMQSGTLLSQNGGSILKETQEAQPDTSQSHSKTSQTNTETSQTDSITSQAHSKTNTIDCEKENNLPSLCQQIYGCGNGVPAAAKITAYMIAMAMSMAFAMKLSSALMT